MDLVSAAEAAEALLLAAAMLGTSWRVTVENVRARDPPKRVLEMIHGSHKSYEILFPPP